jgi:hypothetical protein
VRHAQLGAADGLDQFDLDAPGLSTSFLLLSYDRRQTAMGAH